MLDAIIGPEVLGDMDDIEWELCCSFREASVGFVPFENLDLVNMMRKVADSRIELDRFVD